MHLELFKNLTSKLLNSPEWIIATFVFFVFWLVNRSFTGPTVLNDEIGYLANAVLIAGYTIDGASSYHAGYSFFLAPLFLLFSEPSQIWQAAMILNAFIWAVSFLLLALILKTILPEYNREQLFIALLISALYPTWITMSGYVFTTTAFVFVYLLAVLTFLLWRPDKFWTIIPHSLAVGYLYWIHPIGLAVCVASFIIVGFVSLKRKKYASSILNIALLIFLLMFYREVVDNWLVMLGTPEGYEPLYRHYPDSEDIFGKMRNFDFWLHFTARFAGQISYLLISSFGLICLGLIKSIKKMLPLIQNSGIHNENDINIINQSVFGFLALSLLGVLTMGLIPISFSEIRIDHWIYGRFSEMVVLPILALGYLSAWKKKWLYGAFIFIITTGLLLNLVADLEAYNLKITTVAFWPQYMILESNFLYWFTVGGLVMILFGLVMNHSNLANILVIALMLVMFIFSTVINYYIHHNRITAHGTPSEFVEIIRENYPPGTCVGFNPEGFGHIRDDLQIQKYHLHLFHLLQIQGKCSSPIITYAASK